MKKLLIILLAFALGVACSDDEPDVVQGGAPPTIDAITYDIGTITSSSVVIEFTSNSLSSSGGSLIREIWYKKPDASDWSIKDITNTPSEQLQHLVEGLDFATRYTIKAVFTVGELVRESTETNVVTLPFETTAKKDGFEQILLISGDTSVDLEALPSAPSFYLKFANDSIQMTTTVLSKDSLLIDFQADNSIFFEANGDYVDKITAPVSFQLKDYYETEWKTLEIFNRKPKIDALTSQMVVACTGEDQTKLAFDGLFWNAPASMDSLLEAEDYAISIRNVQNIALTTPVFGINDRVVGIMDGCEAGFDILSEEPVANRFHSGSQLWVSFATSLLPEGEYELLFSVIQDDIVYTADTFTFTLSYQ